MRITPENITQVVHKEVFVFGSNLSGVHGAGAARLAYEKFGAVWNNGVGIQGQSYAIPTKSFGISRSLFVEEIRPYVEEFIKYATCHTGNTFFVSAIGCGLAGHTAEDIAPLFKKALELNNVFLPLRFHEILKSK